MLHVEHSDLNILNVIIKASVSDLSSKKKVHSEARVHQLMLLLFSYRLELH